MIVQRLIFFANLADICIPNRQDLIPRIAFSYDFLKQDFLLGLLGLQSEDLLKEIKANQASDKHGSF